MLSLLTRSKPKSKLVEPAPAEFKDLVGLIALADGLANHIQTRHNASRFDVDADPGYQTLRAVIDAGRLDRLRAMLPKVAVHSVKETRGMLKSMYS